MSGTVISAGKTSVNKTKHLASWSLESGRADRQRIHKITIPQTRLVICALEKNKAGYQEGMC